MKIKPYIKYPGNKYKLMDFLSKHIKINDNELYLEPFLGSGTVLFNLNPKNAICSDISSLLISFLKLILYSKRDINDLCNFLEDEGYRLSRLGEQYYYLIRDEFNTTCTNYYKFMFLNLTSFNGLCRFNKIGKFNAPFCKDTNRLNKKYINEFKIKCYKINDILINSDWIFYQKDYENFLIDNCNKNTVVYLDPPYFNKSNCYCSSEWTNADSFKLLNLIKELPGKFYLSSCIEENSDSILNYIDFKYDLFETDYFYKIGGKKESRKKVKEILIEKRS